MHHKGDQLKASEFTLPVSELECYVRQRQRERERGGKRRNFSPVSVLANGVIWRLYRGYLFSSGASRFCIDCANVCGISKQDLNNRLKRSFLALVTML